LQYQFRQNESYQGASFGLMDIQNDDDDDDDVVPVFLILKYPSILFQMELYCHDLQVRC